MGAAEDLLKFNSARFSSFNIGVKINRSAITMLQQLSGKLLVSLFVKFKTEDLLQRETQRE